MDPRTKRPHDLIGDIHAQQRRKLFRRVALMVALFVALLLVAIALKLLADRRERTKCLEDARGGFAQGTSVDLSAVAVGLEACLAEHKDDPELLGALALVRSQLAAEFGDQIEAAQAAVAALPDTSQNTHDAALARVMLALEEGDLDGARTGLADVEAMEDARSIAPHHEVWVGGMLAIADPDADLDATIDRVTATVESDPSISIQRLLVVLHMHAGDTTAALAELASAREQSRTHLGLAADEALYNALLRQKLPGVADVADQLLGGEFEGEISARDRAHALLARGVVHVHNGEIHKGLELVDEAWAALPGWDKLSRALALEMAMEAGDGARARKWIDEAGLRAPESDIYAAWVELVEGKIMDSLAELAVLPQEHPRVALLQGLALVEQGRFAEADAWLTRADKLLPGRIDVEVARARVEVRTGDPEVARRKLESLAEEEPFAPRAWTGLGEANLAVAAKAGNDAEDALKDARRAFKLAIQRERLPAEAYLQVALLMDRKREDKPDVVAEVLEQLGKAVETNDHLPRYAEAEALYLAEIEDPRARERLGKVVTRQGIDHRAPLALAKLVVDAAEFGPQTGVDPGFEEWIAQAEKLAAPARDLELLRARAALLSGKDEDAVSAATKLTALLAQNPADVEARVYYIRSLSDRDAALAEIRRGIASTPDGQAGRFFCEWSTIMSRGAKRRPAATYAQTCWERLRRDPTTPPHLLIASAEQAVRMVQRDKRPKPGIAVAKQLTEKLPQSAIAWRIRADAELAASDAAEAKVSIDKSLELDPSDPLSHILAGDLQMRFGRKDRAKESYETAREKAKGTALEVDLAKELKKKLEGL